MPPFFTKKIQPCRVFEHESARFEVEFEGDPNPSITWYREDFAIKNSSEFQIHTFGSKSVLIIRQVRAPSFPLQSATTSSTLTFLPPGVHGRFRNICSSGRESRRCGKMQCQFGGRRAATGSRRSRSSVFLDYHPGRHCKGRTTCAIRRQGITNNIISLLE